MVDIAILIAKFIGYIAGAAILVLVIYYGYPLFILVLPAAIAYKYDAGPVEWALIVAFDLSVIYVIFFKKDSQKSDATMESYKAEDLVSKSIPNQENKGENLYKMKLIEKNSTRKPMIYSKKMQTDHKKCVEYYQRSAVEKIEDIDDIVSCLDEDELSYFLLQGFFWQLNVDRFMANSQRHPIDMSYISASLKYSLIEKIQSLIEASKADLMKHKLYDEKTYAMWFIDKITSIREGTE